MKALIISVGTGTGANKNIESLADALSYSINHHNPDTTIFIVTKESQKSTLPLILKKAKPKKHKTILIENPDDIQHVYEKIHPEFIQTKKSYNYIVVDFTSGTKAMTAALAVLAALYEANELSYITGKRKNGIVQPGTEQILPIRPYFISAQQKLKTAIEFFNHSQYITAAIILNEIMRIGDPDITQKAEPIQKLAEAYSLWDKFQHEEALEKLKTIKMQELNQNKRFLGELIHKTKEKGNPEPYLIADLINNAQRRAEEGKYDDAVARLYRTIELIAQYTLKSKYGIDASQCPKQEIPENLLKKWNIPPQTEKIKLALEKDYELLAAKEDPLGQKYLEDSTLRNLLAKRNTSILAHGLTPIQKETWQKLHEKTIEYARNIIENLQELIAMSKFIKINQ